MAIPTPLAFIDPNPVTLNCLPSMLMGGPPFGAYRESICSSSVFQMRAPDAGISDVEPKLFGYPGGNLTSNLTNTLSVPPAMSQNAIIWGVPVTLSLRNALQDAQGFVGPANDPLRETEANMPTLSRQQVTSLYVGQASWSDFVGLAPPDPTVYLCRRVNSSGTQASFEAMFLRQCCIRGAPAMPPAGGGVTVEFGTSDVISCLNNHNAAGRWAVGLLSTQSNESPGWRFVKVDGKAPTLLNVVKGGYPYFSEQSIHWRISPAPTGLTLSLLVDFRKELAELNIIKLLNTTFNHTWGQSGLLALNIPGVLPPPLYTAENITATPMSSQSKSYVSGPNNCLEPALVDEQHAGG